MTLKNALRALGAAEPLDSPCPPKDLADALARKDRIVARMTELDMQLAKPDGGIGSSKMWFKEVRPQVVAEKQRLMSAIRPIKAFIKSAHRSRKMSEAAAIRTLLAIIDRATEEALFVLTAEEIEATDEAAYIVDVIEAACAESDGGGE
jgi:hypothetical protein